MGMRHRAKPLRLTATPHYSGCWQSANYKTTCTLWRHNDCDEGRKLQLRPAKRLARVLVGRKSLSIARMRMWWHIVRCDPRTGNIASDQ
jgi:hypothetical protein